MDYLVKKLQNTPLCLEVQQKQDLQYNFLMKVLKSKRLLVDHIEILEEYLFGPSTKQHIKTNYLNLNYAAFFMTTTLITPHIKSFLRFIIPTVSSTYTILYAIKLINKYLNSKQEHLVRDLIKSINDFEGVIKKNLIFLNETEHLKTSSDLLKKFNSNNEFIGNCISSIVDVIVILYDAVRECEYDYDLEELSDIYHPLEDLKNCEFLRKPVEEFDYKSVKNFYNIFAYVQSHFLMLLALTVGSDHKLSEIKIKTTIMLLNQQTERGSKVLDLILTSKLRDNYETEKKLNRQVEIPTSLSNIKSFSMDYSTKILAIASASKQLDDELQNVFEENDNEDNDTIALMKVLETELHNCQNEFQRLFISYQNFLNSKSGEDMEQNVDCIPAEVESAAVDDNTPGPKTISADTVTTLYDEVFVLDGSEKEDIATEKSKMSQENDEEFERLNTKIVKRTFKPVLKELRTRIEPIGEAMKERERKVLHAKGITENHDDNKSTRRRGIYISSDEDNNDSGDGDSDDSSKKLKIRQDKMNQHKYGDVREFLMTKQQVNIFGLPPMNSMLNEEVLE